MRHASLWSLCRRSAWLQMRITGCSLRLRLEDVRDQFLEESLRESLYHNQSFVKKRCVHIRGRPREVFWCSICYRNYELYVKDGEACCGVPAGGLAAAGRSPSFSCTEETRCGAEKQLAPLSGDHIQHVSDDVWLVERERRTAPLVTMSFGKSRCQAEKQIGFALFRLTRSASHRLHLSTIPPRLGFAWLRWYAIREASPSCGSGSFTAYAISARCCTASHCQDRWMCLAGPDDVHRVVCL